MKTPIKSPISFSGQSAFFCQLFLVVFLLAWQSVQSLSAAQIDLQVSPDQLSLNESFRLIYTATGTVDEEPDFSGLTTDFEILTNQSSSSISMINGDISRTKTWTLELMAQRQGNLVIPPVPFGRDYSPAKAVAVKEPNTRRADNSQQAADLFIDMEVEPQSPYVQQQVLLKVKLYRAISLISAALSEPATTSGGDLVIEKLGEDRNYPANQGGRRYMVVERNYALLPQASGEITIGALQFEGQVGSNSRFGFGNFGGGRRIRVQSDPVTLDVRPIPAHFHGNQWLPATNLQLTAQWSEPNPEFRVGEPVTRVIRLTAEGLAASQLPEISLPLPDSVRSYRDQPQLQARADHSGIVAQREEKIALIPEQAGILKLPAVEIPWWNTVTDRLETVELPAVEIAVLPAQGTLADPGLTVTPLNPLPLTPIGDAAQTSQHPEQSINTNPVGSSQNPLLRALPWGVAGLFALGWGFTGYLWWRDRQRRGPLHNEPRKAQLVRELRLACRANDKQFAARALLAWGKLRYPDHPPPSLEALALKETGDLAEQIAQLAKSLYAETETPWNGEPLWDLVNSAGNPDTPVKNRESSSLAPLNPS